MLKKLVYSISFLISFFNVNAQPVSRLGNDVELLKAANVRAAFADLCKNKGYDAAKYEPKVKELEALCTQGFKGIEEGNPEAVKNAEKAVALQREILMSNPLLNGDKIIVGRYRIGKDARKVNSGELGTQPNNWSNQTSMPKSQS
jgi:hypothetical protein